MVKHNLHTWTRLTRIDLQNLSVSIGNAAVADLQNWPASGEGREVKAAAERMMRILDSTLDRRAIEHAFDNLDEVMGELKKIRANQYFMNNLARRLYDDRKGNLLPFKDAIDTRIAQFDGFVAVNRPKKLKSPPVAEPLERIPSPPQDVAVDDLATKLSEISPAQQAGPLQFEVRGRVLHIKSQSPEADPNDLKNITNARVGLEESANSLLKALNDSNCDPRLIEAVEEVRTIITSGADVIRLGLVNFTCDHLFVRFAEEIPDIAAARFQGLSVSLGLYVAQFPEWHRFTENAARTELQESDISRTYQFGREILPELRAAKGLIDPEVPKSIELVLEALCNPGLSSRRALFGAVRTLENLFAKIFTDFAGLLNAVSEGARSGIKSATTAATATTLLLAVAQLAAGFSPTAERVVKATWLKQAADLVTKVLKEAE